HGEALDPRRGGPDAGVPGLMAAGEAACASVHGANRPGSNSLTDLVVFGRAAALRAGTVVDRKAWLPRVDAASEGKIESRFDWLRHANGGTTEAKLRERMRSPSQEDAAVFRSGERRETRVRLMHSVFGGLGDLKV